MANKKLQQRVLAMERFHLTASHVQMILDLKISFASLAKRQARAWDNNRWTLAQYLESQYQQVFGKSRPKKPAFVPPCPAQKPKPVSGANGAALAHPFYERKATALRQAREQAGLSVLELAQLTNIHPDTIRTLEDPDSRKAVSFETVGQIATLLGLELKVDFRLERPRAAQQQGLEGNEAAQAVKANDGLARSVQQAKLALRLPISPGQDSAG
ncbi:MAG: helix-turn-helix domain-containing protein [Isosphaeraceae bacterium]